MVGRVRQDKKEREARRVGGSAGAQSRDAAEGALQVAEQERLMAEEERVRVRKLTEELKAAEEDLLRLIQKCA
jgi:hypothetical protein